MTQPSQPAFLRRLDLTRVSWALAGLGMVALFASLVSEWVTTSYRYGDQEEEADVITVGLAASGSWGTGWVVGAMALAAVVGLSLFGPARLRAFARPVGLALTGALSGLLAAAAVDFSQRGAAVWWGDVEVEATLERGLYVGFVALALLGAALWLSRPTAPPGEAAPPVPQQYGRPERPEPGAPGELTVEPAEPFTHPTDGHEWR